MNWSAIGIVRAELTRLFQLLDRVMPLSNLLLAAGPRLVFSLLREGAAWVAINETAGGAGVARFHYLALFYQRIQGSRDDAGAQDFIGIADMGPVSMF